ncbi:MAG: hypothetical protein B6245_08115, partial [Desulfobacteraceae bacterium 4572_88]
QLSGSYPRRPYRCQWNETHFQYISRLMEHEGICPDLANCRTGNILNREEKRNKR